LFDIEEDPDEDDALMVAGGAGDSGDLFQVEEESAEDDGLFDIEEDPDEDGGLFDIEEDPDETDAALDFDIDEADEDLLAEETPGEAIDQGSHVGLLEMEEELGEAGPMPVKAAGDFYELEDTGLEDEEGLFGVEELPGEGFSEPDESGEELSTGGDFLASEEGDVDDDGLQDLGMELPDEVPPPPPIISASAHRAISSREAARGATALASGTDQASGVSRGKKTDEDVARLEGILKAMADQIEGVRVCAISGMDGIGLAEHNPKGVDTLAFGGKFAVVMQLIGKSAQDLNIGRFQENLVQTENAWVLTRFLSPEYYLVIAAGRESTVGNVRMVASKYSGELDEIFRA
ncbi:MAG: hypothetical protein JEZ02_10825, partial [Desulfatibacillum sp.]|nr:hypothetical protein [Desulfatibacillum sp.]